MRGRIPESVRTRADKMGFPTPGHVWFAHDLFEPMQDLLASKAVCERGIYNISAIKQDLQRHRNGQVSLTDDLFRVAEFEIFMSLLRGIDPPRECRPT